MNGCIRALESQVPLILFISFILSFPSTRRRVGTLRALSRGANDCLVRPPLDDDIRARLDQSDEGIGIIDAE